MGNFFYGLADRFLKGVKRFQELILLMSEIASWTVAAPFIKRGSRKGEITRNILNYGMGALPIVGVIMFLIGFISTIQSAAQLKMFGANIFVADLLGVGIMAEMGPLMTAIIVAGRSGSAIAAEISTMKFTEEFDALETMGMNPLRFVMVPKMWAMLISLPILTMYANALGILGGTFIAVSTLDLSLITFWNQLVSAISLVDIVSGLVKSVVYAILITVTGCYQGLQFSGGAEGVGKRTTAAVVMTIFYVIAADAVLGIIFYF